MKNLSLLALLFVLLSCQEVIPQKDYVVVHGKIENPIEGLGVRLFDPVSSKAITIKVAADGTYRDTIKLDKPAFFNTFYDKFFGLYLANDMDLEINFDAKNVSKSLTIKGKGEKENAFLRTKSKLEGELYGADYIAFLNVDKEVFDAKINKFTTDFKTALEQKKSELDPSFVNSQLKMFEELKKGIIQQYADAQRNKSELGAGKQSPDFKNYINYDGGKSSLSDFRGSYVFIDVWATWCGPCKYEFPFIGKVEKEFHGKNIKFVSISIDRLKDEQKWRDMIIAEGLSGIHLLADKEIESSFIAGYYIQAIPRFIILDKQGKIINSDAPRPSEPELTDLLNSLDM
ncbi:TlpA family protein disulfide reductase [Flavobacterium sp. XN-5]|uniref:TlpA family protein disulfide reductase n=1 Tax=Flavobacterium sp. XN-5 TaxID=2599390 RepID=UPI0011CC16DF|nr:TlpA disulfide reductase family protein [Flavobacterium sp. XN-5]NGY37518.1 TlpA family protein disulfide reductase [Flavobacterium sp. XN-5]